MAQQRDCRSHAKIPDISNPTSSLFHLIIHKYKPCTVNPLPTVTHVMLMWFLRSDHKDWILCDHIIVRPHLAWEWLLYISPGCFYFKICLDNLNPHTSYSFFLISLHYSKLALRSDCNQIINRAPFTKQTGTLPDWKYYRAMWAQSDFWESRPSLNTSWHHWMIKFHGWLQPMGDWDQQGQLEDCKDMSQHP